MPHFNEFSLKNWIDGNENGVEISLAGSVGPTLTLNELTKVSNDPKRTTDVLNKLHDVPLAGLTGPAGILEVRQQIARLYDQTNVQVTADDVVSTNGATGANLLLYQSLLSRGDHVVAMYPSYEPLLEVPKLLGAEVSYWKLDFENDWKGHLEALKSLVRPSTKLIVVNNPHNPTGSVLSTAAQQDILKLAAQHDIVVHADEIFRPLFHGIDKPASIVEHSLYDRAVATGSLSKAWCMNSVRVGWCVTRNAELKENMLRLRHWTVESTSVLEEIVAAEVLSERCRDPILNHIHGLVKDNLVQLRALIEKHPRSLSCSIPRGGAIAFVKFIKPQSGEPVDDVQFCRALKREHGVLLSPGSHCFGQLRAGDFQGYVRMHVTGDSQAFKRGLERISQFLESPQYAQLGEENGANGVKANGPA